MNIIRISTVKLFDSNIQQKSWISRDDGQIAKKKY